MQITNGYAFEGLKNKNLAHERIILTEWNVLFFLFPIGPFQNFMICILALIPFFSALVY